MSPWHAERIDRRDFLLVQEVAWCCIITLELYWGDFGGEIRDPCDLSRSHTQSVNASHSKTRHHGLSGGNSFGEREPLG